MTDRTYDAEDPKDLPYRFVYSPITDEVFVVVIGHGIGIAMMFENRPAFHRFLVEGNQVDDLIQGGIIKEATNILKAKQNTEE